MSVITLYCDELEVALHIYTFVIYHCSRARLGSELDRSEPNCIELGTIQNCVETCRTDPVRIHFGHTSSAPPAGVVLPCGALVVVRGGW